MLNRQYSDVIEWCHQMFLWKDSQIVMEPIQTNVEQPVPTIIKGIMIYCKMTCKKEIHWTQKQNKSWW